MVGGYSNYGVLGGTVDNDGVIGAVDGEGTGTGVHAYATGLSHGGPATQAEGYALPAIVAYSADDCDPGDIPCPIIISQSSTNLSHECILDSWGNLSCTGTKSAVVNVASGKQVALYAVESPENWFEDFGSAKLSSGVASVKLDPVFAQTVNSAMDYHIFLTPNGDCNGLYVSLKTATSFEVHELGGGVSNVSFDYRIVARRKGYESVRMADVTEKMKIRTLPGKRPAKLTRTVAAVR